MSIENKARGDFAANNRLLLLAAIALPIGVICSFVALFLTKMINFFTNLFYYGDFSLLTRPPTLAVWGAWAILVPALGGLIIGLMARFGTEKIRGHGIPEALEAILFGKSIMNPKVAILKPLSSAISIGSGGPFGAEGPIIMTGGACGSLLAQAFNISSAERKTLLVAGAAAGMAAVFASPIAAVFLAIELLLFEWKPRSLVPVAVACATAAGLRPYLMGAGPIFPMVTLPASDIWVLASAVLVGLLGGAFSTLISNALYKLEDLFHKLPVHWMWWPMIGGIVVGIGGFYQPRVLGVGYDLIAEFLQGNVALQATIAIVAIKGLVWIVALASGTSGGVLAPLLIMGCGLGVVEASFLPGDPALWPLISMAAVMGGMMRSPFTAVVFALELTHQVNALPPLLVAAVAAYCFTVLVMKRSILTEKVARRGFDIFREYSVDPLERLRVEEIMTRTVISVQADLSAEELAKRFFGPAQRHRGYPVLDQNGGLLGVVTGGDVLRAADALPKTVGELVAGKALVIRSKESCRIAAERMAIEGVGRLLVVADDNEFKLLGIITRSDLLKARAQSVVEEQTLERVLGRRNDSK